MGVNLLPLPSCPNTTEIVPEPRPMASNGLLGLWDMQVVSLANAPP